MIHNNRFAVLEYDHLTYLDLLDNINPRILFKGTSLSLFQNEKTEYLIHPYAQFKLAGKTEFRLSNVPIFCIDQITVGKKKIGIGSLMRKEKMVAFSMIADSIHIFKTYNIPNFVGPYTNSKNDVILLDEKGFIYGIDTVTLELIRMASDPILGRIATASIDNNGNKWICTHDNGVYVYPKYSSEVLTQKKGATCLTYDALNNKIIAGFEDKSMLFYGYGNSSSLLNIPDRNQVQSRITNLVCYRECIYIGGDFMMGRYDLRKKQYSRFLNVNSQVMSTIKDMELCEDGRILLGSANGAGYFSPDSGKLTTSIWTTRTTAAWEMPDKSVFLGTVNGLHVRTPGQLKPQRYITGTELDNSRITDIKSDRKGRLWVGTAQRGLYIIDGKNIINLNDNREQRYFLTSYYVKCIFIRNTNEIWVGTDKGINCIVLDSKGISSVNRITTSFGIPNDNIGSLWVVGDTVYIASLDGVARFSYNSTIVREIPGLEITGVVLNGKRLEQMDNNIFRHNENNIGIEYSAIAFRSAKNIEFDYRLAGKSDGWIRSIGNRIDLLGLKPGNYTLEIRAINTITGELSPTRHTTFTILKPWYMEYWFLISAIILLALIIWYLVVRRINIIKRQSEDTNRIHKQFAELEMQALRAQMNPHFIFNALSAIQNYFVSNKEEKANAYMARFARLIRQMLDYSKDNFIPLEEEISLLNNYMELEKMRFENKLEFELQIDKSIDPSEFVLPSLLLHPYWKMP